MNYRNKKNNDRVGNENYKQNSEVNGTKLNGIILKGIGGLYTIIGEDGNKYSCRARGVFRHEKISPLVGDKVEIIQTHSEGEPSASNEIDCAKISGNYRNAVINSIYPRKNSLIRPPLANIDIIFVIIASAYPEPSTLLTDKLITISEFNKIEPVIVISKNDLAPESAVHIEEIYRKCGFTVFSTSSQTGVGIENIKNYICRECAGKISTFSGVSGAGKSSLLNALFPDLSLKTGELSQKINRGKNTTRHEELFSLSALTKKFNNVLSPLNEGYIADTPGFSMIDFTRFNFYTKDDLPFTFREFNDYITHCRYTKCTHTREQGCAIIDAVEKGIIPKERHISYTELYNDLKNKNKWD